jgi:signal transduction histidine kinase
MEHGDLSRTRILAVDDEESILALYRGFFQPVATRAGSSAELRALQSKLFGEQPASAPVFTFDLVLNRQGDEAIESVRAALAEGAPFAVVFLDVRMPPGPDGVTTAEEIRALDPDIEIVIVTGYSDVHPHRIAQRVPPPEKLFYLQKPVHALEIQQLAAALGAKWRAERKIAAHTDELEKLNQQLRHDIVARKQAEEEKERLQAQLRHKQKMEALGTLAGGVAHDFNNILTAIIGYAELSQLKHQSPAVGSYLEQVLQASRRGEKLIRQIMTFSRRSEQIQRPVEIGPVVKECLELLRALLPAAVTVEQDIEPDTGLLLADPDQIHQVVMNLGINAGHAMREQGGTLSVSLAKVVLEAEDLTEEPELDPGAHLELVVRDSGHGIEAAVQERIFEPFFTTKERGEGTGMGLAVVHGIVHDHHGAITVTSEPGAGASFRVLLPCVDGELELVVEPAAPELVGGSESILLVDDEQQLVNLGIEVLQDLGYRVVGTSDPSAALDHFRRGPHRFDLVITDMSMPKLSGLALAIEIRRIRPDVPVILSTGYLEESFAEMVKVHGISELLKKPFSVHDISSLIRKVLDQMAQLEPQE